MCVSTKTLEDVGDHFKRVDVTMNNNFHTHVSYLRRIFTMTHNRTGVRRTCKTGVRSNFLPDRTFPPPLTTSA